MKPVIKTALALCLLCVLAIAQSNKPKAAVYIVGDPEGREVLRELVNNFLVKSGRYQMIAVDAIDVIAQEHRRQMGGSVSDADVAKLGQDAGAAYVCVVARMTYDGGTYISTKMVGVQSKIAEFSEVTGLNGDEDIIVVVERQIGKMLGISGVGGRQVAAPKPASPASVNVSGHDFRDDKVGIDMIFVKGGTFKMGCTSEQGGDCNKNEKPAHSVVVNDFYIGKFEVSQKQWKQVMGRNPSSFRDDDLPVENVSWNDAQAFISELRTVTGKKYRLLTEAEWEYAARGGSKSMEYKYSGSSAADKVAWYNKNSDRKTQTTGTRQANELGIYDMSGNVWEWVSDWYGNYSSVSQFNPQGPSSGSRRVLRGGSWYSDEKGCRVSYRGSNTSDIRDAYIGFRLALSP